MALLRLEDIGKIYVSESGATVGIRGVNLEFDRGEVVAVTGKSGSGKSTLLNVISGMDSYEEGELYVDGEPTSHFLQPDWEEYRKQYISFIFQDYNIIDSFTVLENVELALMHIEDKKERRRRALELIERVGLASHARHKGSRLSGGQKQRTVIARALAKDSPIILADEPTGNLDSKTSEEIIKLLYEVSRDKLLIVVTHNFEQLEACATRHIRIFDGAVESDVKIGERREAESNLASGEPTSVKSDVKNGFSLGYAIFKAKPRLSVFLCILMTIGALGVFALTAFAGVGVSDAFGDRLMFNHVDGRVVVVHQNGTPFTDEEIGSLTEKYGAKGYMRFDSLLDGEYYFTILDAPNQYGYYDDICLTAATNEHYGDKIIGRYPEKKNELLLYLPISYQERFGKDEIKADKLLVFNLEYNVVGVKYYYDNNRTPRCLFTEEGLLAATASYYFSWRSDVSVRIDVESEGGVESIHIASIAPTFALDGDSVYPDSDYYSSLVSAASDPKVTVHLNSVYYSYDYWYSDSLRSLTFSRTLDGNSVLKERPDYEDYDMMYQSYIIVSDELLCAMAEEVLSSSYKQLSLFFEDDKAAGEAAEALSADGYIAVPSYTTYTPDAEEALISVIVSVAMLIVWFFGTLFLGFFIHLCSGKALEAFRTDMAIMRSMGIKVRVIRVGMYVRMLISLVPAFASVAVVAALIYTTPVINGLFGYLYGWQYALIALGMILLTVNVTHRQIRRLFSDSVKKAIKGGVKND